MTSSPTSIPLLERLVAFDTESSRSNLDLIDFVSDYLAGLGVEVSRHPNAAGDKAALLATVGPRAEGGVVLSGHTDCVPVAGQAWTGDPFRLRVEGGRAIGRGAVDMKGFDALCLAAVPAMLKAGLKRPIHICLSYDEETTCLGANDAIARFGRDLPLPAAAIVGEPTELAAVDAHKSVATFLTRVHGHEAHSAKPELGASAVMAAAELMAELNRIADEMVARGDPSGRFDPSYTTVHVGQVEGGNARNILARLCWFNWEFRGLPDLDPNEIPERFKAASERVARDRLNRHGAYGRIETEWEILVPGLAPDPGSTAERLVLDLVGANATTTVPFGTEAGHFQAAGIPTIVCGPGSIDQAHQADEYIALDALADGEAFLGRLIARMAE
ncbi:acetylornithine deacetylase [Enterovirga rhinocerotis]|uniref:Acetylornithine deacetylase n=1 Tax=Enterovirga rhinocerotis TaxID=1339210 RepID=A0A4R7C097_9HYPH|nr:acetylornithine deacetylase [Enterovirga rhinocerotis]TDR89897.1 acetylornithine deacetylase [Enterovirga rhinocerotis]